MEESRYHVWDVDASQGPPISHRKMMRRLRRNIHPRHHDNHPEHQMEALSDYDPL